MKKYFPILIDLEDKNILVVGGGKIAYRKITTLLSYGGTIEIITPTIADIRILELLEDSETKNRIKVTQREFRDSDVKGRFLIIGATDNKELNKKIYKLADAKNILINNISTKIDLNTRFSAIIRGEDYQVAVSTYEGNPTRALEIKNKIKDYLNIKKGNL